MSWAGKTRGSGRAAEKAPTRGLNVCVCGTQRPTGKSKGQVNGHKGQLMAEIGNGVKGSSGGITLTMNINT